ncbi:MULTISPECIES: LysR substrate-binding domain-containing protein [Pseudomonas]|uniref:LysR substrate-binding domain-containing protein n=1 Tax=Pseudomonas TaxID=286 RepID=UPI000CFE7E04|nr:MULTISPECIES: LysR substrate-binding domain-containing protein [Pseudomonas]PRA49479.1 LysR family transcriptional regulator [Pseudomonas sp. MYb115]QXN47541.1 LysR family transcriptional regulator [Pseudomonas fluorescens]WSO21841.1 LysR substrate-binding domain-containing protein [Pseudomonas fluorescens]
MKRFTDYRLPSIDALLAFDTAARLKSFELTAQALSLTGSALRKRIASLEQLLGLKLFDRQHGTLMLTAQGQVYLEQIRPVLVQLVSITAHQRPAQRKQRLTISCPPTFARQILIPRLQEHSHAFPDIDLQIELSAPLARAESCASDLHICGGATDVEVSQRLLDERLQPMAAPALLARYGELKSLRNFPSLPLLRSPMEPWQPWFAQASLNLQEPDEGPALLDLGMMLEAAVQAQGVVLARPSLALAWLADGRLVPVGEVRSVPTYHYRLLVNEASSATQAFSHWLIEVCSDTVQTAERHLSRVSQGK